MSQYDNVKDIRQTPEIRPHSLTLRDLLSLSSLVSFETWPHYPWLGWNLTEFHWPLLLRLKVGMATFSGVASGLFGTCFVAFGQY